MDEGVAHVARTLAEVDQILAQIQPQVGPLLAKLNEAADQVSGIAQSAHQLLGSEDSGDGNLSEAIGQLDQAARSIRTLADYLDRHPEALIRGKRPDHP